MRPCKSVANRSSGNDWRIERQPFFAERVLSQFCICGWVFDEQNAYALIVFFHICRTPKTPIAALGINMRQLDAFKNEQFGGGHDRCNA